MGQRDRPRVEGKAPLATNGTSTERHSRPLAEWTVSSVTALVSAGSATDMPRS